MMFDLCVKERAGMNVIQLMFYCLSQEQEYKKIICMLIVPAILTY